MSEVESPIDAPPGNQTLFKPNLNKAFAKAQGRFRVPKLNRTAKVMKSDGRLHYETYYADLEEIIDCIRTPLLENGLGFKQIIEQRSNGAWYLVLKLSHESGEIETSEMPLNMNQFPQQVGGLLTYFKRYQASAFFGLAADFDDDGNSSHDNDVSFGVPKGKSPVESPADKIPNPKPASIPFPLEAIDDDLDKALTTPPKASIERLLMLKMSKRIPNEEMKSIIHRVTATKKTAKELSTSELEKVLEFIQKFK